MEIGHIQQGVINLVNNAAEAMPEAVQEEIFNPFFTTKKEGSGLGLYLVKQIVERHMGSIECTSVEGEGTTFRIRFPAQEPTDAKGPVEPPIQQTRLSRP